ncbi:methionine--tRNA ligase [Candidatus Woesearchaeota archaeon]|nr:methionine--tRNA ligase [Candidatus Woesearchaeota archaeon]
MAKYYITTAIDYPNALPHIGHAYEKVLADALARWNRLAGKDVFFLTGVDEHGQKIEKAAEASGKKPKAFVNEMVKHFIKMNDVLEVSYDRFIRTTEEEHEKIALAIFDKVKSKGLIYKGEYEGLYCVGCEAFYTEKDLVDGKCPFHNKEPDKIKTESYFFKLSEFQDRLIKHIKDNPEFIQPETRRNEILSRLKEPLRDLSISRTNFKWGISVPGDPKHVLYVWFDALLNYLSGIDYPGAKFKKFWPADCQQIGKDIIWFHTVIWPAILMAAEIPLPKQIFVHGFLTVNGMKMSKSLGNVLDPVGLAKDYGADKVRYYLLREVNPKEDGDISIPKLIERTNADLADALGNLLQRTVVMTHKYFDGKIPECSADTDLIAEMPKIEELSELMANCLVNRCAERIWEFIAACNRYINETEPWKVKDKKKLGTIIYTLIESLRNIAILVSAFIPESAEQISKQIGQKLGRLQDVEFRKNTKGKIPEAKILFQKSEMPTEDPFSSLNLKVAEVKKVKDHPEAEKLYILEVDVGEKRQLVAGLKPYMKPEELLGKKIVMVTNLKPAKLRGIESNGMLLAADKGDKVRVLEVLKGKPGEQVFVEGIKPKSSQIKYDDFAKIKMTVKDKKAVYGNKPLRTEKENVVVDIGDGAKIR